MAATLNDASTEDIIEALEHISDNDWRTHDAIDAAIARLRELEDRARQHNESAQAGY